MTSPSVSDLVSSFARFGAAAGLVVALAAGVAELGPPAEDAAASARKLPRSVGDFTPLGDGRFAVIRFPAELAVGDATCGTPPAAVPCPAGTPSALAGPGPDGALLVGFADGALRRRDPSGSESRWELLGLHDGPADLLCLSPDGRLAAAASNGRDPDADVSPVAVFDAASGDVSTRFLVPGTVDWIGFAAGSDRLVTRAGDGTLSVWRARDGEPAGTIVCGRPGHGSAACAPAASRVAWCGPAAAGVGRLAVRVCDLGGGEPLWEATMNLKTDAAASYRCHLSFSPDGTHLACGTPDAVALFDAADGRLLAEADAAWHRTAALRFVADGRALLTAGGDGTVRSWGVPSLTEDGRIEDLLPD